MGRVFVLVGIWVWAEKERWIEWEGQVLKDRG